MTAIEVRFHRVRNQSTKVMNDHSDPHWSDVSLHLRDAAVLFLSEHEMLVLVNATSTGAAAPLSEALVMPVLKWATDLRFNESMLFLTLNGFMLPFGNAHGKLTFRSVDGLLAEADAGEYRQSMAQITIDQRVCDHCLTAQAMVASFMLVTHPEIERLELATSTAVQAGAEGIALQDVVTWSVRVRKGVGKLRAVLTGQLLPVPEPTGNLAFRELADLSAEVRRRYTNGLAVQARLPSTELREVLLTRPIMYCDDDNSEEEEEGDS